MKTRPGSRTTGSKGWRLALLSAPLALLPTFAAAQTDTELAGNALSAFPYFEYVRAFNANAPVQVAIDPTRFPGLVGQQCDVYVVEDKTAAQWAIDPSLVDVTAGGFLTVTFAANGITANTVTVAAPGELASSAGTTDLGRPYDVVLDCDRDGTLSRPDFIDGRQPDQGGFYVVHDLTTPGPLAFTSVNYTVAGPPPGFTSQRTFHPSGIAGMGKLPLIIISHGNWHDYTWYDYLEAHLASYGYIVMSHQNDTAPGIESCSLTTLQHTDAIIGQQGTIAGGVLDGHIDASQIVWIGHSRGGEGVVRAFDRITDEPPSYTPTNFTSAAIKLISSIAPTDFLGPPESNPRHANYHLIYGAADGDVSGVPGNDVADSFHVYERAEGLRSSDYLHGVGHGDFTCCAFPPDATGPDLIGRAAAQAIAKGYYLALVKRYLEGNVPAKDFLWRPYESLHPIGAPATARVALEFKEGPDGKIVIDDFQTEPSTTVSSSGGTVTIDVDNLVEGLFHDADDTFAWSPSDPMNGMTRARTSDTTAGIVFDADRDSQSIEWSVVPGQQDFSGKTYLSFRACQGTRHPLTTAELRALSWTVSLRDGTGRVSGIDFGVYGGGIGEPYQRTGAGTGAGWQNEFETVRIRLTDFLSNGQAIDLANIVAIRIESPGGRIGFDDLEVVPDP